MNNKLKIKLIKIHEDAILPCAAIEGDVGHDIYSVDNGTIEPGETKKISTGLKIADDIHLYLNTTDNDVVIDHNRNILMKIEGRSSLASKGIFPIGGIIDPTYRGEIKVILHNAGKESYEYEKGNRVAQLVFYPVIANITKHDSLISFEEVKSDQVNNSIRGESGFGSSGS